MSDWVETTLGQVTARRMDFTPVDPDTDYVILGVQRSGWGFVQHDPKRGRDQKFSKLMRVGKDDLVYRTITAFEAPSAVAGEAEEGLFVTPQTFPVFRLDHTRVLPGYMRLLTTWPQFHHEMAERCTGTVLRRKTLSTTAFAAIPICLPSLAEQRRIFDVMAAVDAQIDTLAGEARRGQQALVRLIADSFVDVAAKDVSIVDLCSHVIGGVWGSPKGESEVDVLALGPRIYTPGTTDFVTAGSPVRSFSAKQAESRAVQPNDIILERSGGSPEQPVGRVVIAGRDLEPCVPTDFQRLMRPDPELVEPRYLYWRLKHDWNAGLTRSYSRQTTGITNLSVTDYIARLIPVPSRDVQIDVVTRADALDASSRATVKELCRLRALRSTLLSSLLSQDVEIPESYDVALGRGLKGLS